MVPLIRLVRAVLIAVLGLMILVVVIAAARPETGTTEDVVLWLMAGAGLAAVAAVSWVARRARERARAN
jgi:hypothetical protein